MNFWLKNGNKRQHLTKLQDLAKSGVRVRTLEQMPELDHRYEWVWHVFEDLSSKRISDANGLRPIQASELLAYAEYHQVPNGILREDMYHLVSVLDRVFLSHQRDAARAEARKGKGKTPPKRPRRR